MMYLQLWGRALGYIFIFLKKKNKGCRRNPLRELQGIGEDCYLLLVVVYRNSRFIATDEGK